ncbi:MAG: hypothetical protein Q8K68_04860 [Nitrospirota bacterium]|nr:hypothetical protein [Nitrospirota bacterium]
MFDRFSLALFCLLAVFFAEMPASGQKIPQVPGAVSGAETAPASPEVQEPQPEPPKSVLNVELRNDLLSVELENVDFGTAIRAVADKAGFKIEGTGDVFSRKLNTRFTDIEVERGVIRLLSLVQESNYMLNYNTKGLISKLEIFGISSGKAPSVTTRQPLRPTPATLQPAQTRRPAVVSPLPQSRPIPPVVRRRPVPSRPIPPSQSAAQPSGSATPQASEEADEQEETVNEIPYIAPQPRFLPAPAR